MLFRFRGQCLACGHEWDGLRRQIECARVDFDEPESYQCRSCARCVVELYAPRLLCRSSWLRWVAQNASELTRSPLQLRACELGVTIELEALEVIARSAILLRACERVSAILSGTRSRYEPAPIDLGPMTCPDCAGPLGSGELDSELLVCPACEESSATWSSERRPASVRVDYSPLAADHVRRIVARLQELAEPPRKQLAKRLHALPVADSTGGVWDRQMDG